ncbi:protein TIFY 5A-like isoform X2 [Cynara cardunculus var. scolymus]|uniref:Protein TIFY n=1 Tax=Cynara cardunculus var. scolymus TaxID=59895 RepID=A0A103XEU6_CYNCS|nr:protein TIFY 5A-like isoform X2 [Cynara cardunculus var. scolymus]KVH89388.1 CO/COL/TOC1, conserved site-containing protein [Cynara cardunculus var. scolymus]
MRRNCNLELRLVPPSPFLFSDHHHDRQETPSEGMELTLAGDSTEKQQNHQQLTIFYGGKVSICDVTELQARTIIKLASEEMEEKWRRTPGSTPSSEPSSPLISPPVCSPAGLSMKRSLQRFLQKRKHRIQATSPYHH